MPRSIDLVLTAQKIDSLFQSLGVPPTTHVIIEPHPDVLKYMKDLGWYEKKGVRILEGRWQDFVTSDDILGVGGFDVIYTDPFSEDYSDLHGFFEHLPDLLAGPESRFSFFNGLGATSKHSQHSLSDLVLSMVDRRPFLRCLYTYLRITSHRRGSGRGME